MLSAAPPVLGGTDSLYLSNLSARDKSWDIHRANADIVEKLYKEIEYDKYSERVRECSKWLEFALEGSQTDGMTLRLYSAHFCRVRHCPVCQWRRSLMWRARFLKAMPKVIEQHPQARYVFLTLTVKNCPIDELRQTVTQMNKAWSKLTRRKHFPATGFVRSLEVTRNPQNGTANPHFHALLMVRPSYFSTDYLSQKAWTELWQSCLKVNYTPIVNVKAVRGKKGSKEGEIESLIPALCETLKYSVKEADLVADPQWLGELTRQLFKTRAISVGGILKDYLSEEDPEDLIHGDEDSNQDLSEYPKLIFDWSSIIKRYSSRE